MPSPVEQIKSQLDIVDVIGEYVRLKQSGQNFKGLCPFHHEKTPSFMAHREKQIWHCFGCGLGGDIFEFIEKMENVDFPEALEILARKANIEIKPQDFKESGKRTRFLELVAAADDYWHEQLLKSPSAQTARDYLKKRGIDIDIAKTFHLGYAPDNWEALVKYLKTKNYTTEEMLLVGLITKNTKGTFYDKFRDRIMFPIADIHRRTIGFGGRMIKIETNEPKYMNSPQCPVYNKSLVLYNLDKAKSYIKETGYALLVEGYMDVIGCWQAGITNVVSTSGTALTREQVKLLKRYTKELRLAFDADLAGQSASERGIDIALQAEMEVKVISLPAGEDPDTWARKESTQFKQMIKEAKPIGDYTMDTILKAVDINTREGKKQAAQKILQAIAKLSDPVEKDYYLKQASQKFGIDDRSLRERFASFTKPTPTYGEVDRIEVSITSTIDRQQLLSERLLSIILYLPDHLEYVGKKLAPEVLHPMELVDLYRRTLVFYTERKQLDLDAFKQELASEADLIKLVESLWLRAEQEFSGREEDELSQELSILLDSLQHLYLTRQLKVVSGQIKQAESDGNQQNLVQFLEKFNDLSQALAKLSHLNHDQKETNQEN